MNEASEELGTFNALLRGTYRTIKNPPPEGFFKSKDAFLYVYPEDEEVLKTSFNPHSEGTQLSGRCLQSYSWRPKKRIISLNRTKVQTQCVAVPRCSVKLFADANALQIYNSMQQRFAYTFRGELTIILHITQNRYQSWKFARDQGNLTLPQPVLTVYPTKASCTLFLWTWKKLTDHRIALQIGQCWLGIWGQKTISKPGRRR